MQDEKKMTEVELCRIVKESNLFPGYRLYEEVGIAGVSCDMIYENGDRLFCIEAKMQLNFKLLEQACRWRTVASASFIAVPRGTITREKSAIIDELGLGVIIVGDGALGKHLAFFGAGSDPFVQMCGFNCADFYIYPADWNFWKPCIERIEGNATPAGSKLGKRSTTFSRTIEAMKIEAQKHPEYSLDQLLAIVPTHYSDVRSAAGAIKRYAKQGIIKPFWSEGNK